MVDKIRHLLAIQEKDILILELEEKKNLLPRNLQDIRQRVGAKMQELESSRVQVKESQVQQKKIEIEVESKKSSCNKYEGQLNLGKTNQEYKALEKEIFSCKADISRMEDELLEKLMLIDRQNATAKRFETELQEEKSKQAVQEQEIQGQIQKVESSLKELRAQREVLVKSADDNFYRRYVKILNHVKGRAIVPLVDQSCQGCHTKLTAQIVIDTTRSADLVSCDNCARILYILDEAPLKTQELNSTSSSSEIV